MIIAGAVILLVIGVSFVLWGVFSWKRNLLIQQVRTEITGRVESIEKAEDDEERRMVVIHYEWEGQGYVFKHWSSSFNQGDWVRVYVDPKNPHDARVLCFEHRILIPTFLVIFGALIAICAIVLVLFAESQ